jgi:PAS domain S-box-containing protein
MLSDLFTAIDLSKILLHNPPIAVSSLKVTEAISLMNANRTTCSLTDKLNLKQPQLLTEAECNCVLVVENNQLVGILTERDVVQLSAKSCSLAEITLAEVMINPIVTLQKSEFTDLFVALNLFEKYQIRHLPIVDEQGKIVGLLTHNSLQQLVSSIDWLRLRQVTEVMTTQVVYAQPTTSVARLTQLLADHQVSSVVIVEESEQTENHNLSPIGIVTEQELVQLLTLELNFAQIQAQQVMSSTVFSVLSDASLYSVWMLMEQKQTNQVVIKNTQDYLLGIVTLTDLFKAFNPLEIYRMVDKLEKQVSQLEAEKLELIESQSRELEKQVQKRTTELQTQYQKERLVADITSQIRESLNLQNVLNTTVAAVRSFLQCDRVLLYQFDQNWNGKVVVESVSKGELSIINQAINDPCLISKWHNLYQQGWITTIDNVETSLIQSCHKEMLANFQVRANLVLPILRDSHLWGLLIVHECCQPRHWHLSELDLLKQITEQVAIALQQAAAYEQVQTELEERRRTEQALRESEAQLKLAFEAARMGSWNWNIQKGEIKWSTNMEALFGLAPGEFDGSYKMFVDSLHPEDRDRVLNAIQMAVATGANYNIEFRVVYPNGTIRWALSKGKVFYDQQGQPVQMAGVDLDITERKTIEARLYQLNQELEKRVAERTADLQQSEARLQEAQAIARMGNWEFDVITGKITWSPELFKIFGLDTESTEPNYQELTQYIHPDSREHHQFLVQRAIFQAEPYETDLKILRQDGTLGYIFVKGKVVCNRENQVVRLFGIVMEITERKQAELALKASESKLQGIIQTAPGFIATFDRHGTITYVNRTTEGFSVEQILGKNISEFLLPQYHNLQNQGLTQIFEQGETVQFEVESYIDTLGNTAWYRVQSSPVWDGDRVVMGILTAINISDLKQAETDLRESENRYAILAETSPVGIFRFDSKGNCIYVNERWQTMTGRPTQSALGRGWLEAIHPEDRDRLLKESQTNLTKPRKFQTEGRHLLPDGAIKWFLTQTLPEIDPDGKQIGFLGTLTDITERKQAEAKLQEINQQLELSNQQLERATSLKDEFLANMSHEFRTPLNTILGMSEALQEEVFGVLNEEQQKTIAAIESSGRHLLELINDILDVAKIEAGKLELNLAATSVQELCQSSLIFIQQQALKKRIQLNTNITSDLGSILVDQRRMRQVLINLLNNAVKFTPSGGSITLEVKVESANFSANNHKNQSKILLEDTLPASTSSICFAVTDTGIGIAAENLDQLFQPFIQIDSALNRQYSGTGLGLCLVKQIIELHGGFITVNSEVGCGSCFKIYLPYNPTSTSTSSPHLIPKIKGLEINPNSVCIEMPESKQQHPVILLVEDEPTNTETFSDYLESRGYQIIVTNNGQEAIAFAMTHNPDLILMDIQLSMMNRLEIIRDLRIIPQFSSIPIIALSPLPIDQALENCLAAGATEYFTKPVRLKQLVTTIEQLLNQ